MSRRLDLSKFRGGSDSEEEGGAFAPPRKPPVLLDALKQQTFSHGVRKKTKKEIEKENEERKRVEEEKAAAIAFAEFEEAFNGDGAETAPRGGTSSSRSGSGYPPRGPRSAGAGGFVRAGGDGSGPSVYQPPTRQIPTGPSARGVSTNLRSPSPEPLKSKPKGKRAMDTFLEEIKREQQTREEKFGKVAKSKFYRFTGIKSKRITKSLQCKSWKNQQKKGVPYPPWLHGKKQGGHMIWVIQRQPTYTFGISEESLGMFFAKLGPIGAVKIMWPRGDEDTSIGAHMTTSRRQKAGLSGFVAYMKRKDAEVAVKELDGLDWGGCIIRVGWSKMIRLPIRPIYELANPREERYRSRSPRRNRRSRSRSPERTPPRHAQPHYRSSRNNSRSPGAKKADSRLNANDRAHLDRRRGRSPSRSSEDSWSASSKSRSPDDRSQARSVKKSRHNVILDKILSQIGPEKEQFITAVAQKVRNHGSKFEEMLRDREGQNEKFAFLRNMDLPEYHFYQLCLDPRYRLPSPPPDAFTDDGRAELYSSDSAEDSEKERTRKGTLGKISRKRFESGLRAMTGNREEIARLMEFAMVHADAAEEVCDIICQSMMIETTQVPRKLARLHLISDILHNSASPLPNVWRYRHALETRLPAVMEHLADLHRSLVAYAGRLSGESFKSQVIFVIEIWENWIVFTPQITEVMRSILNDASANPEDADAQADQEKMSQSKRTESNAPVLSSKFKTGGFKKAFVPVGTTSAAATVPATAAAGPTVIDVDLDGEAMEMDDDIDGVAIDSAEGGDFDGEPIDLDGEVIDLDGEAIRE